MVQSGTEAKQQPLAKGCITTLFELVLVAGVVALVVTFLFFRAHPGTTLSMALEEPALLGPMARNFYTVRLSPLDVQEVFLHPRAYEGAHVSIRGVPRTVVGLGRYSSFQIDNGTSPGERLTVLSDKVAPHEGVELTVHGWIRHGATFGDSQTIFLCEFEGEPPADILKAMFTSDER